jgi:hypothetical protein
MLFRLCPSDNLSKKCVERGPRRQRLCSVTWRMRCRSSPCTSGASLHSVRTAEALQLLSLRHYRFTAHISWQQAPPLLVRRGHKMQEAEEAVNGHYSAFRTCVRPDPMGSWARRSAVARLAKRSLHGQLGRVAGVHARAEGLDEALKHLCAQVAPHKLLHRLLETCAGSRKNLVSAHMHTRHIRAGSVPPQRRKASSLQQQPGTQVHIPDNSRTSSNLLCRRLAEPRWRLAHTRQPHPQHALISC